MIIGSWFSGVCAHLHAALLFSHVVPFVSKKCLYNRIDWFYSGLQAVSSLSPWSISTVEFWPDSPALPCVQWWVIDVLYSFGDPYNPRAAPRHLKQNISYNIYFYSCERQNHYLGLIEHETRAQLPSLLQRRVSILDDGYGIREKSITRFWFRNFSGPANAL